MKKKSVETCEMCGAEVHHSVTVKIEGALLTVCNKCSSLGNIVNVPTRSSTNSTRKPITSKRSTTSASSGRTFPTKKNVEKELTSDYAAIIRSARMKKKLNQEELASITGLSIPFIKSVESGKMRPTDSAAAKLERELNIEILFVPEIELEHVEKSKEKGTTLGDIAVIKRFDYERN